jgi:RimJ/RimL family protein N-acetyltransferase
VTGSTRRIVLPGEPLRDGPTALRPWRESDAERLSELACDPVIRRFTRMPRSFAITDARTFTRTRPELAHAGLAAPFAIVGSGDGLLLGSISLTRIAWPRRGGEIGYWLGADARGQGHATRAVRLLCAWGQRALGLERIELVAAVENPASQAVARRAGFTEEVRLRSFLAAVDGGARRDAVGFGLLATDRVA